MPEKKVRGGDIAPW